MRKRLSIEISEHMHKNILSLAKKKDVSISTLIRQTMVKAIVTELFIPGKY